MKVTKIFLLAGLFGVIPFKSWAWGQLGHRVIGGIAEQHLTAKTKVEIRKLLGNESLAMASNWADFIKSDRLYDYLSPWHYVNIRAGLTQSEVYQFLDSEGEPNLFNRINFVIRELKSGKLTRDRQVFYLRLLIHFAGDAHQPMHVGQPEDRGGNNIKVYWFGDPTNLHRVWDEHLIDYQQLSFTEYVASINFVTPAQKKQWQTSPVKQWVFESYKEAQNLYSSIKPEERLSYKYNYQHQQMLNMQLLKGGIRLAAILNNVFDR